MYQAQMAKNQDTNGWMTETQPGGFETDMGQWTKVVVAKKGKQKRRERRLRGRLHLSSMMQRDREGANSIIYCSSRCSRHIKHL